MRLVFGTLMLLVAILVRTSCGQSSVGPQRASELFAGLSSYSASGGDALSTADARRALERVIALGNGGEPAAALEALIRLRRPTSVLSLRQQQDEDAFAAEDLALIQRWRDAWLTFSKTISSDNPRYVYDEVLATHHPASRALTLTLASLRDTSPEVDLERTDRAQWRRDVARRLWSENASAATTSEVTALQRKIRKSLWTIGGELQRVVNIPQAMGRAYQSDTTWLLGSLPANCALIDLQRYTPVTSVSPADGGAAPPIEPHYCAFLVAAEQTRGRVPRFTFMSTQPVWQPEGEFFVTRIELGPAGPLEAAAEIWVRTIRAGQPDRPRGQQLTRLLWEPLRAHVPGKVGTIITCGDGPLGQLPWCALPLAGDEVLLDRYRLASVPFPQFLVLWLTLTPDDLAGPHYGGPADRFDLLGVADATLPTAVRELAQLQRLLPHLRLQILSADEASPERVLADLPRARVAHFALHGSFSQPALEVARRRGLLSAAAANEIDGLHYGALHLRPAAGRPRQDGLLTANMLLELHLTYLQLAVLAACQTGQGIATPGEGTLSFVHALHWAGCANVIGTLWSVEDGQTTLLMEQFYDRLWRQGLTPLDALRAAQLHLYRHPTATPTGSERTPVDEADLITSPDASQPVPPVPVEGSRTATRHWAGFFLSGAGGLRSPNAPSR